MPKVSTIRLRIEGRPISAHKAASSPDFTSKTVLVTDTWDYMTMWLKRKHKNNALFFWDQARHFHDATAQLPNTSAPLTAYYCFLNAVKALLIVRGLSITEQHGITGDNIGKKVALSNEQVTFLNAGVLPALCRYLGETAGGEKYTLKDLLYNLPYIHRAYNLTFSSRPELFIPVAEPRFVRKPNSSEAWFCADVTDQKYKYGQTVDKLPTGYERDIGVDKRFVIRRTKRFTWLREKSASRAMNLQRLSTYHASVRKNLYYIHGPTRLWYVKRRQGVSGYIARSSLTITFAVMHRLSELARYNPMLLSRHFESQHNWLLCEFIATARSQFIDEISSEITGQEFMIPGRKSVS